MTHDDESYDDLSSEELHDEIEGLDKEIADCQTVIAKAKRSLKQKQELQERLIDIWSRRSTVKGWQK